MTMSEKEFKEFKRVLEVCQNINADDAFDKLANFICDNLDSLVQSALG